MQKKMSGLGKGLDELLEDNHPTSRTSASGRPLIVAKGEAETKKTAKTPVSSLYGNTTKTLYDTKPRTKSVKSNFKK